MHTRMMTLLSTALLLSSCDLSSDETRPATEQTADQKRPAETVRDETHRFHKDGLVEAKVVPSHLGDKDFMPGGNFAEYERDGQRYQVFFTLQRNADVAMFLSMDYRDALTNPKFIPHFGGFYGLDGETPTLIFQKNKYLVVITGLELDAADQAGRMIAGRLN